MACTANKQFLAEQATTSPVCNMSHACGGHNHTHCRHGHGSGETIESVARIIAALTGHCHKHCPAGKVLDTVYYNVQLDESDVLYTIVDNAQFFSYMNKRPLTSEDGQVALSGTSIVYQGQSLKEAEKFSETFFLEKEIVGGPSGRLSATLTYKDTPDGDVTSIDSNRFLVTAAEGAWEGARFVDIDYNNTTGLRTVRIVC